jgi:hypothetical protein
VTVGVRVTGVAADVLPDALGPAVRTGRLRLHGTPGVSVTTRSLAMEIAVENRLVSAVTEDG